jgi:hypothetical protein
MAAAVDHANRVSARSGPACNALVRYNYFALPLLFDPAAHGKMVNRRLLHHVLSKIDEVCGAGTCADGFEGTVHRLTAFCRGYERPQRGPMASVRIAGAEATPSEIRTLVERCFSAFDRVDGHTVTTRIWSPCAGDGRLSVAVIVDDTMPRDVVARVLEHTRHQYGTLEPRVTRWLTGDPVQFGSDRGYPLLLSRSMWRCWLDLFPLEAAAIGAPSVPVSSLRRYSALQYGVWLINRNDWVKEPHPRRERLFAGMIRLAETLTAALRTGTIDFEAASVTRSDGLARLYGRSSDALSGLREAILQNADEAA